MLSSDEDLAEPSMILATGKLKREISTWPGISVHPHQFVAREYRSVKRKSVMFISGAN